MYAPQGPFTNFMFAAVREGKALLARGKKVQEKGVHKFTPCCWSTELMAVASLQFPGRNQGGEEKPASTQQMERV